MHGRDTAPCRPDQRRADGRRPAEDPVDTGRRRNLSLRRGPRLLGLGDVEVLRHTGIRIEELLELSHHSLIQYRLPTTGEIVPLLQIAPSKTDTERLLLVSPELADVLSAIICRSATHAGAVPLVAAYDPREASGTPPMPLLFQRRIGSEHRAISTTTIRKPLNEALDATGLTDATGEPLRLPAPRLPQDLHHRRHPQRPATAHRPDHRRAP